MSNARIGALRVDLGMNTAAFEKGVDLAQRRMNGLAKSLKKTGDKMASIGTKMSIGITAPLTAFGVSAFNAASDAAELEAAFGQTFGGMTADMQKWAEATGDAMGRSTQEMQKAANTFGIFFNAAGATNEKAAEMSQTFSELAQDLGSFYNVDTETAIQKLRSGLSGEAEPLRDFGVFLNEAAVKARAMEMGLTGVGDELTDQEKILARYSLIMEQTANAQGDVARTSDGTANQMRKSKAAFEELQVVVGTKLLPALTPLIEKLGKAIEWFTKLPTPVQDTVLVVGALSAAFGPVLVVVGNLLPLLAKLGPVLGVLRIALLAIAANPIILGLTAVIAGIYYAWKNWDKIEPILRRLYLGVKTWIIDKLGAVWKVVTDKIDMVKNAFRDLYVAVVGNSYIPDMVDGIGRHMGRLQAEMVQPVMDAAAAVNKAISEAANDNVAEVEATNVRIVKSFKDMADETMGALQGLANSIKGGGFLDILSSVIGLGLQLGSIGAFGKKVQTNINSSSFGGARANGGPVMANKSYLIGERGPEIFTPSGSGSIIPNGGGGANIQVIPSPYFDVVVDGRVMRAAPGIADAGGQIGMQRMAYRNSRRVA